MKTISGHEIAARINASPGDQDGEYVLAAVARELLAALEALRRLLAAFEADSKMMPNTPMIISWETNGAAIAQARAAIAAAEA